MEDLNLCEILKDAPKGMKLYSPLFGEVELLGIKDDIYGKYYENGECMLFPSRDNRDWSQFEPKPEYNFKPFDRVLVRDKDVQKWRARLYAFYYEEGYYKHHCTDGCGYMQCIHYKGNEELCNTTNKPK